MFKTYTFTQHKIRIDDHLNTQEAARTGSSALDKIVKDYLEIGLHVFGQLNRENDSQRQSAPRAT